MEKLIERYQILCAKIEPNARLVAISKGRSVEQIQVLYEVGCRDFGENRVQEFLPKWELLPKDIRWHFVGPLQKNKVSRLIGKCHCIHSIDSLSLAEKVGKCSKDHGIITSVLVQVNVSGEESKQGFSIAELAQDFERLNQIPCIQVDGLMTMAPFTEDREKIRSCFQELRKWRDRLGVAHLSMGMSHDYQIALEESATLVRVGSILFED